MIIWRGWGILSVFITLLVAGIVGSTFQAFLGSGNTSVFFGYGLGLILAGVANYFFGRQVNELAPARKIEAFKDQMRHEMWDRVAHGSFQVGPGASRRVRTLRRVSVTSTPFSSSRSSGSERSRACWEWS